LLSALRSLRDMRAARLMLPFVRASRCCK
jgi:hypothetical protein